MCGLASHHLLDNISCQQLDLLFWLLWQIIFSCSFVLILILVTEFMWKKIKACSNDKLRKNLVENVEKKMLNGIVENIFLREKSHMY